MKKSFLLLAGLILLAFTACQNDELVNGGSGNETAVSFSVQLPGANAPSTRAAGDGTQVNRCIMEIYLNDGEVVLSTRYYPGEGPIAVSMRGIDGDIWPMKGMEVKYLAT